MPWLLQQLHSLIKTNVFVTVVVAVVAVAVVVVVVVIVIMYFLFVFEFEIETNPFCEEVVRFVSVIVRRSTSTTVTPFLKGNY